MNLIIYCLKASGDLSGDRMLSLLIFKLKDINIMPKIPLRKEVLINEDTQALIESIIDWAEDHTWYNTDFVCDLHTQLEKQGNLSDAQVLSLENIIHKNQIEQ